LLWACPRISLHLKYPFPIAFCLDQGYRDIWHNFGPLETAFRVLMALCGIDTLLFPLAHLCNGRGVLSLIELAVRASRAHSGTLDTDECDTALDLFMLFTGDNDGRHPILLLSCTWDSCFRSFSWCGACGWA
jgi:hypothetical protein